MRSPHDNDRRGLLGLLFCAQLVTVVDFMMVMPLGPDLAREVGLPVARFGLVGASYMLAAAAAGLAAAPFADRLGRRAALVIAMTGLAIGTLAGAVPSGPWALLAARFAAGAFGGPAASIVLSIIADAVPEERRGRAMGMLMAATAVAWVLGVPATLELARLGGARLPFVVAGAAAALVAAVAAWRMPAMDGHVAEARRASSSTGSSRPLALRPEAFAALAAMATSTLASFLVIPNFSAYLQLNAGYPREKLALLYLVGGAVSLVVAKVVGRLVDRLGATLVSALATAVMVTVLLSLAIFPAERIAVLPVFVGFMVSTAVRFLTVTTTSSCVAEPGDRARFASWLSAVQHLASGLGAAASAQMLYVGASGRVEGVTSVVIASATLALALPLLLRIAHARMASRRDLADCPGLQS